MDSADQGEECTATVLPPSRPWLDGQALITLIAAVLVLAISYFTNYQDDAVFYLRSLPLTDQIGLSLHLAALAALFGDAQLATRLRHRAANEAARDQFARQREAYEADRERDRAAQREQRQNRALRAGALFLLEPSPLHRRFLAFVASELATAADPPEQG
ncbi:MAG: hypothetical protein ACK5N0_08080 [Synechococcaceae cyanobacterium]